MLPQNVRKYCFFIYFSNKETMKLIFSIILTDFASQVVRCGRYIDHNIMLCFNGTAQSKGGFIIYSDSIW